MGSYWRRKYSWDLTRMFSIVLIPFLLALHLYFDTVDEMDTIYFFGFSFRHGYNNTSAFVWAILVRIIPLLLIILWYLNCPFWWRHFILASLFPYMTSFMDVLYFGSLSIYLYFLYYIIFVIILLFLERLLGLINKKKNLEFRRLPVDLSIKNYKSFYHKLKNHPTLGYNLRTVTAQVKKIEKLYNLKTVLAIELWNSKKVKVNKFSERNAGRFIIFILALTPISYFIYRIIPEGQKELDLVLFSIYDNGFADVHTLIWYVGIKLCILISLSVWFVTCPYWWRYYILSPIILFAYQLREGIRPDIVTIDQVEYFQALPFVLVLIFILLFISKSVKYKSRLLDIKDELAQEIEEMLKEINGEKACYRDKVQVFKLLKLKIGHKGGDKSQLAQLLILREELILEIMKNKTE